MTVRQHVVVGVDGSITAFRALDRAVQEAALRGAALEIVYAVPDIDDAGPVPASAVARARRRCPGLEVGAVPVAGDAVDALTARGRDAVLTVVGSRDPGGLTRLPAGSVGLRLAAHSRGPLLVVRGQRAPGPRGVLLGVGSDADAEAAAYAFEEAARRSAPLRILHTWTYRHPLTTERVRDDYARHAEAEQALPGRVVALLRERYPRIAVETRTLRTGPAHALLQATASADVVVVAAHRHRGLPTPRLGPVTHALLHHSHCPVVVVPCPGPSTRTSR
ncbi:universal stress protein [Streptomyces sp. NBC_01476]|uniref:universal stress protein n=1 Tax=Streptomyces sp. NBC_01476 TaxID=2903881 RepID=UPI002E308267|nr:universal stress protein [Streptomyces sp. NBC_01476]